GLIADPYDIAIMAGRMSATCLVNALRPTDLSRRQCEGPLWCRRIGSRCSLSCFAAQENDYGFATKHHEASSLPGTILQRCTHLASSSFSASSSTLMSAGLVPGPPAKCPHSVS